MKIAATCLLVVLTCSCHEVVDNLKPNAAEKVGSKLLEVESLSLTKETLRLDYRVTNVFPHDIWICGAMSQFPEEKPQFTVETEIRDRTLWIGRRGNLKPTALVNAIQIDAVYYRLQPGDSRSGTVLLPLPVEDWSHVRFTRPPVKPVVLDQVVLELGYFDEDLRNLLPEKEPLQSYRVYRNGYFSPPDTAFVPYIIPYRSDKLDLEKSVQILIPDVNVPGMIAEKAGG